MKTLFVSALIFSMLATAGKGYCRNASGSADSADGLTTSFSIETGYTLFLLSDARSTFNRILDTYRQIDIPLQSQVTFPGNMLIGGSVMFSFSYIPVALGLGAYYSKTAAVSSYKDFAGTILERMDVNMVTIHFIMRAGAVPGSRGLFAYAEPGVSYGGLTASESVNLTYPTSQSSRDLVSEHGWTVGGEVGAGIELHLWRWPVTIEAGYREAKVTSPSISVNGASVPIDISGMVVKASVGMSL